MTESTDLPLQCPLCHSVFETSSFRRCPRDGTPLRTPDGRVLGRIGEVLQERYQVTRFLGKGGMAQVYEANHLATNRKVAIKIVEPRQTSDPVVALERFRREALILSRIAHPNVVAIEDFGNLPDGTLFMVMELLQGRSLQQALAQAEIPAPEALDIVLQVCEAVQAAHDVGTAHRDLKPGNIFLETPRSSGKSLVKVLDFGISKLVDEKNASNLTKAGTVFGTPEYMSPQQAKGEEADLRSDIYSLGILLYRLLLGTVPFPGDSYMEVLIKHLTETPPWPRDVATRKKLPLVARDIVLKAIEKDPENRYPSVGEFANAIQWLQDRFSASYSLVRENVESVQVKGTIPTTSAQIGTSPLESVKGSDMEVATLAPDVYWVGRRTGGTLECNTYLRVYERNGLRIASLIDPGPPRDLDVIGRKVAAIIGSIAEVDILFINHQDPDVSFNATTFQQVNPNAHVVCSKHTWRLIHLMGLEPQRYSAVEHFPDNRMKLVTGHEVLFVPTPFCHFRGAVMYYDLSSRVLFTGDLFGGLTRSKFLLSRGRSWEGVDTFHQIYMPSGEAVRRAIGRIRKLEPAPLFLAPQHGVIFSEDQIGELLTHLEQLPMGMDREMDQDESQVRVFLNELIHHVSDLMGEEQVRMGLKRLEGDDTFPDLLVLDDRNRIEGFRIEAAAACSAVVRELTSILPVDHQDAWYEVVSVGRRKHGL